MSKLHILQGEIRRDALVESPSDKSLIVPVRMARTGVRSYYIEDSYGDIIEERDALLPEHLFAEETLASAKGIAITHYHPWSLIDTDNWSFYAKGVTIGEPRVEDNTYVVMDVKVFDKDLQAYILSGMSDGCSIGFIQKFVEEPGEFEGEAYDGYNTEIRFNHLAFCDRKDARGGEDLGVKLDTTPNLNNLVVDTALKSDVFSQARQTRLDAKANKKPIKDKEENLMDYRLDGKVFQVDEAVVARLDALTTENASLRESATKLAEVQTKLDTVTGEKDALAAAMAEKDKQIAEITAKMDAMPTEDAIVKSIALAGFVSKITGVEESYKTDTKELMIKALSASYPEEAAAFAEKSEAYLEARLDMLKANLDKNGYPTVITKKEIPDETRTDTLKVDSTGRAANHFSNNK